MRARNLVLAVVCAAACKANPDPREPSVFDMERGGLGGWVRLTTRRGTRIEGELISIDRGAVRVLVDPRPAAPPALHSMVVADLKEAELFRYTTDAAWFGVWTGLGGASTISHGYFVVFSFPIWLLSGGASTVFEARHEVLTYPPTSLSKFAPWARFPQGMPPGLDPRALLPGEGAPAAPAPAAPVPTAPVPAAPAPVAPVPAAP